VLAYMRSVKGPISELAQPTTNSGLLHPGSMHPVFEASFCKVLRAAALKAIAHRLTQARRARRWALCLHLQLIPYIFLSFSFLKKLQNSMHPSGNRSNQGHCLSRAHYTAGGRSGKSWLCVVINESKTGCTLDRSSASSRSMYNRPSKWSYSCWKTLASHPSN
jgi:hypothetical protein